MNGRSWIPIVITLIAQTAGVIWWARGLAAKVDELQVETARQALIIAEDSQRLTRVQTIQEELIKVVKPYDLRKTSPQ